mmetsp:Transcript_22169/g.76039  ORF Transcript_22169/g.76039 Transcript_22169/m.76039 type:complete len:125 (-) Transcript_22169:143-517(-)|eukprot:CAMPEP_0177195118 /NCGR_PEP_ID=MMETSP0367-20130122/23343_1 /TAXON_ID=447022 ORGANISM="Scrippsiella hangoei-like, Strain SHHI-4" /NCGR_SAMPLE_ID=MMETSP0367 /ASSEMBLY_ACC=CAM_ASM_000362 /LENGTH=124 /DNA_ID=CAMNT_0018643125 /DNA_START=65 /DNA_END=439 /DNA_ORIENTATION=+
MAPKAGSKPDAAATKGKVQQKEEDGEFLFIPALQHNMRTLGQARLFSGVMAGIVAGLLKCEGLSGIFVFIVITALHSAMIFLKMSCNVTRHFPKASSVLLNQFASGLMPFILFWIMAFDMVHIF